MEEHALKRAYPRIRSGQGFSYGGSQNWFPDENMRLCGCGIVACADVLLYLSGRGELTREEYLRYVDALRRYFPLIPRRGIDGLRLALGMNILLRRRRLPYRARWCASGQRFWQRIEEMLSGDLPAVISIGPNFPRFWGAETLPLYRRTEEGVYQEAERTKAHFLTVTGLDNQWLRVSTWGRMLYIERRAYERYMRSPSIALLSNLLYLEHQ